MSTQNLRTPEHASVAKLSGVGGLGGWSAGGVISERENQEVESVEKRSANVSGLPWTNAKYQWRGIAYQMTRI
jgi:hypothetical protein